MTKFICTTSAGLQYGDWQQVRVQFENGEFETSEPNLIEALRDAPDELGIEEVAE
jgi:hypothetical protein